MSKISYFTTLDGNEYPYIDVDTPTYTITGSVGTIEPIEPITPTYTFSGTCDWKLPQFDMKSVFDNFRLPKPQDEHGQFLFEFMR